MTIDRDLLKKIAGRGADSSNMNSVLVALQKFGEQTGLGKPHRLAHYLAQLGHESAWFKYDREIWGPTPAQKRYEGRKDLGNIHKGDGSRFRGRGPIQVTGRSNYRRFTTWCKKVISSDAPNFEEKPTLLNTDPWEGLSPIWYWDNGNPTGKSLNRYADDNNIEMVTRRINGGLNGYADRIQRYVRAGLVLLGYTMKKGVVAQFQKDHNLTADDVPGPQTLGRIHAELKKMKTMPSRENVVLTPDKDDSQQPDETNFFSMLLQILGALFKLLTKRR